MTQSLRMSYRVQTQIISKMAKSDHLFVETNMELFLLFVSWLGPNLDKEQDKDAILTDVLLGVRERADLESTLMRLAVVGLVRLREDGWPSEDL